MGFEKGGIFKDFNQPLTSSFAFPSTSSSTTSPSPHFPNYHLPSSTSPSIYAPSILDLISNYFPYLPSLPLLSFPMISPQFPTPHFSSLALLPPYLTLLPFTSFTSSLPISFQFLYSLCSYFPSLLPVPLS